MKLILLLNLKQTHKVQLRLSFLAQHQCGSSQLSVNPVPGDDTLTPMHIKNKIK